MCMGDCSEEWIEGGPSTSGAPECQASESEVKMARLVRTIEGEIVPRLVLARRVTKVPEDFVAPDHKAPDESDVKELVRLLLAHDVAVVSAYVETVRQRGATLELICLKLLAPAARELGLLWEEDECDFMQVTVGLCRLHQLLRELSPEFRCDETERTLERRILLAPCPGEQHTFGISLVAQFLRQGGLGRLARVSGKQRPGDHGVGGPVLVCGRRIVGGQRSAGRRGGIATIRAIRRGLAEPGCRRNGRRSRFCSQSRSWRMLVGRGCHRG